MNSRAKFSPSRTWRRIRTVPGLGRDVAAVTGLVIVAIVATTIMLSQTTSVPFWEKRTVVWAEFAQAPAVNPESTHKVTIAGVTVGKITDWRVTDKGTAELELNIEPGHQIYSNAHAVLGAVNPLNEMYVELSPGGPPGTPLPRDGIIPMSQTERPVQAEEVLKHLDDRTQLALTSLLIDSNTALARAPQDLPVGLRSTSNTLVDLKPVVTQLQSRREQIAQLVTAVGQISNAIGGNQDRVTRLADATQQTLGVLAENDDHLKRSLDQFPGLSDDLRHALTSTQALTDQLNPTLDNLHRASENLPPALDRFTDTTKQIGDTVHVAKPFVEKARPVVEDLRPFIRDVDDALDDALPVTKRLDSDTKLITSYLTDIQGFVYNTSSVFGLEDANGGFIRGHVVALVGSGGALPGGHGGYAPGADAGFPRAPGKRPSPGNERLLQTPPAVGKTPNALPGTGESSGRPGAQEESAHTRDQDASKSAKPALPLGKPGVVDHINPLMPQGDN